MVTVRPLYHCPTGPVAWAARPRTSKIDAAKDAARNGTHASFAISRSLNFWILPVEVFGNSANTT